MRPVLSSSLFRQALRPQPRVRFASTNAESARKSAQENAGKLWESTKRFMEPVGQRVGRMLGSYKQPITYNLAVARELIKQVYVAEGLQPPSLSAIRSAYASLWAQTNVAGIRQLVNSGEAGRIGVYAVQAYGIFKIGEMIGRRSVIGYDLH